ncbi:hypothetical protein DFP72DRAFT_844793 [Ephemerocybe angulata]|uniref:Uncharacterized protein n=1 Tax=Ephemerocybe angulata TaxID=980116 RepID=A0A8H6I711_9AGAR|nr:hypothetical protein DFP72DRAFT_844793 [Tulosesus angulatus]
METMDVDDPPRPNASRKRNAEVHGEAGSDEPKRRRLDEEQSSKRDEVSSISSTDSKSRGNSKLFRPIAWCLLPPHAIPQPLADAVVGLAPRTVQRDRRPPHPENVAGLSNCSNPSLLSKEPDLSVERNTSHPQSSISQVETPSKEDHRGNLHQGKVYHSHLVSFTDYLREGQIQPGRLSCDPTEEGFDGPGDARAQSAATGEAMVKSAAKGVKGHAPTNDAALDGEGGPRGNEWDEETVPDEESMKVDEELTELEVADGAVPSSAKADTSNINAVYHGDERPSESREREGDGVSGEVSKSSEGTQLERRDGGVTLLQLDEELVPEETVMEVDEETTVLEEPTIGSQPTNTSTNATGAPNDYADCPTPLSKNQGTDTKVEEETAQKESVEERGEEINVLEDAASSCSSEDHRRHNTTPGPEEGAGKTTEERRAPGQASAARPPVDPPCGADDRYSLDNGSRESIPLLSVPSPVQEPCVVTAPQHSAQEVNEEANAGKGASVAWPSVRTPARLCTPTIPPLDLAVRLELDEELVLEETEMEVDEEISSLETISSVLPTPNSQDPSDNEGTRDAVIVSLPLELDEELVQEEPEMEVDEETTALEAAKTPGQAPDPPHPTNEGGFRPPLPVQLESEAGEKAPEGEVDRASALKRASARVPPLTQASSLNEGVPPTTPVPAPGLDSDEEAFPKDVEMEFGRKTTALKANTPIETPNPPKPSNESTSRPLTLVQATAVECVAGANVLEPASVKTTAQERESAPIPAPTPPSPPNEGGSRPPTSLPAAAPNLDEEPVPQDVEMEVDEETTALETANASVQDPNSSPTPDEGGSRPPTLLPLVDRAKALETEVDKSTDYLLEATALESAGSPAPHPPSTPNEGGAGSPTRMLAAAVESGDAVIPKSVEIEINKGATALESTSASVQAPNSSHTGGSCPPAPMHAPVGGAQAPETEVKATAVERASATSTASIPPSPPNEGGARPPTPVPAPMLGSDDEAVLLDVEMEVDEETTALETSNARITAPDSQRLTEGGAHHPPPVPAALDYDDEAVPKGLEMEVDEEPTPLEATNAPTTALNLPRPSNGRESRPTTPAPALESDEELVPEAVERKVDEETTPLETATTPVQAAHPPTPSNEGGPCPPTPLPAAAPNYDDEAVPKGLEMEVDEEPTPLEATNAPTTALNLPRPSNGRESRPTTPAPALESDEELVPEAVERKVDEETTPLETATTPVQAAHPPTPSNEGGPCPPTPLPAAAPNYDDEAVPKGLEMEVDEEPTPLEATNAPTTALNLPRPSNGRESRPTTPAPALEYDEELVPGAVERKVDEETTPLETATTPVQAAHPPTPSNEGGPCPPTPLPAAAPNYDDEAVPKGLEMEVDEEPTPLEATNAPTTALNLPRPSNGRESRPTTPAPALESDEELVPGAVERKVDEETTPLETATTPVQAAHPPTPSNEGGPCPPTPLPAAAPNYDDEAVPKGLEMEVDEETTPLEATNTPTTAPNLPRPSNGRESRPTTPAPALESDEELVPGAVERKVDEETTPLETATTPVQAAHPPTPSNEGGPCPPTPLPAAAPNYDDEAVPKGLEMEVDEEPTPLEATNAPTTALNLPRPSNGRESRPTTPAPALESDEELVPEAVERKVDEETTPLETATTPVQTAHPPTPQRPLTEGGAHHPPPVPAAALDYDDEAVPKGLEMEVDEETTPLEATNTPTTAPNLPRLSNGRESRPTTPAPALESDEELVPGAVERKVDEETTPLETATTPVQAAHPPTPSNEGGPCPPTPLPAAAPNYDDEAVPKGLGMEVDEETTALETTNGSTTAPNLPRLSNGRGSRPTTPAPALESDEELVPEAVERKVDEETTPLETATTPVQTAHPPTPQRPLTEGGAHHPPPVPAAALDYDDEAVPKGLEMEVDEETTALETTNGSTTAPNLPRLSNGRGSRPTTPAPALESDEELVPEAVERKVDEETTPLETATTPVQTAHPPTPQRPLTEGGAHHPPPVPATALDYDDEAVPKGLEMEVDEETTALETTNGSTTAPNPPRLSNGRGSRPTTPAPALESDEELVPEAVERKVDEETTPLETATTPVQTAHPPTPQRPLTEGGAHHPPPVPAAALDYDDEAVPKGLEMEVDEETTALETANAPTATSHLPRSPNERGSRPNTAAPALESDEELVPEAVEKKVDEETTPLEVATAPVQTSHPPTPPNEAGSRPPTPLPAAVPTLDEEPVPQDVEMEVDEETSALEAADAPTEAPNLPRPSHSGKSRPPTPAPAPPLESDEEPVLKVLEPEVDEETTELETAITPVRAPRPPSSSLQDRSRPPTPAPAPPLEHDEEPVLKVLEPEVDEETTELETAITPVRAPRPPSSSPQDRSRPPTPASAPPLEHDEEPVLKVLEPEVDEETTELETAITPVRAPRPPSSSLRGGSRPPTPPPAPALESDEELVPKVLEPEVDEETTALETAIAPVQAQHPPRSSLQGISSPPTPPPSVESDDEPPVPIEPDRQVCEELTILERDLNAAIPPTQTRQDGREGAVRSSERGPLFLPGSDESDPSYTQSSRQLNKHRRLARPPDSDDSDPGGPLATDSGKRYRRNYGRRIASIQGPAPKVVFSPYDSDTGQGPNPNRGADRDSTLGRNGPRDFITDEDPVPIEAEGIFDDEDEAGSTENNRSGNPRCDRQSDTIAEEEPVPIEPEGVYDDEDDAVSIENDGRDAHQRDRQSDTIAEEEPVPIEPEGVYDDEDDAVSTENDGRDRESNTTAEEEPVPVEPEGVYDDEDDAVSTENDGRDRESNTTAEEEPVPVEPEGVYDDEDDAVKDDGPDAHHRIPSSEHEKGTASWGVRYPRLSHNMTRAALDNMVASNEPVRQKDVAVMHSDIMHRMDDLEERFIGKQVPNMPEPDHKAKNIPNYEAKSRGAFRHALEDRVRDHAFALMQRVKVPRPNISPISSISAKRAKQWHKGKRPGPNTEKLELFLLAPKGLTATELEFGNAWNEEAAKVFVENFMAKYPSYEGDAVKQLIKALFLTHTKNTLRSHYQIHVYGYSPEREGRLQGKRVRKRREQRHERRLELCYAHRHHEAMGAFHTILKHQLSWRGCSGDETDTEHGEPKRVIITTLPWRAKWMRLWMQEIDDLYKAGRFEGRLKATVGNFPHSRFEPGKLDPTKEVLTEARHFKPVAGLPRNFYCEDWLKTLDEGHVRALEMKEEMLFELPPCLARDAAAGAPITSRKTQPLVQNHDA